MSNSIGKSRRLYVSDKPGTHPSGVAKDRVFLGTLTGLEVEVTVQCSPEGRLVMLFSDTSGQAIDIVPVSGNTVGIARRA